MRLREHSVFLRLLTYEELLDDGRYLDLLDDVAAFHGATFDTFEDVGLKLRPTALDGHLDPRVGAYVGQGFHQAARFLVRSSEADVSVELNAMSHPYSGNHVTLVEWKMPAAVLDDDHQLAAFLARFSDWIDATAPIWAYAHDTDDNTIQNTESALILRRGFGVDVDEVDVSSNPGREVSRAEFRYCANWLTYAGPAMLERLGSAVADTPQLGFRSLGGGRLYQLYETPSQCDTPAARAAQTTLIEDLGFEILADKERWRFGHWQRKH